MSTPEKIRSVSDARCLVMDDCNHESANGESRYNEKLKTLIESRGNKRKRKPIGQPEELFDKKYISAMKMPDTELMYETEFVEITDNWRTEWQRGVQIRVADEREREPKFRKVKPQSNIGSFFRLPPTNYIEISKPVLRKSLDENDSHSKNGETGDLRRARKLLRRIVPRYNADLLDQTWLDLIGQPESCQLTASPTTSAQSDPDSNVELLERVFWMLDSLAETRFKDSSADLKFENGQGSSCALELDVSTASALRNGGSRSHSSPSADRNHRRSAIATVNEHDESTVCDVCRSGDVEEDNEIVFCDGCGVAVHQACYGILEVPTGDWFCRPCEWRAIESEADLESRPAPICALCFEPGGALKATAPEPGGPKNDRQSRTLSGSDLAEGQVRWCHVSCVLWIPECTLGDVTLMEPVCRLESVPRARYSLECSVCRKRRGACAQCAAPHCCRAFHVPCAFRAALRMDTVLTERNEVRLLAYCPQHSAPAQAANLARAKLINSTIGYSPKTAASRSSSVVNQVVDEGVGRLLDTRTPARLAQLVNASMVTDLASRLGEQRPLIARIASYWLLRRASECVTTLPQLGGTRGAPPERASSHELASMWPSHFGADPATEAANATSPKKPKLPTDSISQPRAKRRRDRKKSRPSNRVTADVNTREQAVVRLRSLRDNAARCLELCSMVVQRERLRAEIASTQAAICDCQLRYFYFADDFEKLKPAESDADLVADFNAASWSEVADAHRGDSAHERANSPSLDIDVKPIKLSKSRSRSNPNPNSNPNQNPKVKRSSGTASSSSRVLKESSRNRPTARVSPAPRSRRSRRCRMDDNVSPSLNVDANTTGCDQQQLMPSSDNLFSSLNASWQSDGDGDTKQFDADEFLHFKVDCQPVSVTNGDL